VKLSRLHKMIAGVFIIFTGIGLFLDSLGLITFGLFDLWPMVLVYFGVRMWGNGKRVRGAALTGLGVMFALDMWLGIGIDDLFQLAVPLAMIYFGFRLIRSRTPAGREKNRLDVERTVPPPVYTTEERGETRREELHRPVPPCDGWHAYRRWNSPLRPGGILMPKDSRSSLIGDFHLTSGRFELSHLYIWHGVGNVVIDLSRALLVQEEALLVVDGWIGDVTIYVPVDMPVAISACVSIGDLEVFGHRQGGFNRHVLIRSEHYEQAEQKVKLNISLIVGDIDVKYI
jgi:lia operon protein LiaF